jgi:hypothetical protein
VFEMTAKKEAAPVLAYRNGKGKMSKGKSSICILPLPRAAVKLAITADLVLLLAALGSLNIPATLSALLALNLLCGLYPKEASSHEEI